MALVIYFIAKYAVLPAQYDEILQIKSKSTSGMFLWLSQFFDSFDQRAVIQIAVTLFYECFEQ